MPKKGSYPTTRKRFKQYEEITDWQKKEPKPNGDDNEIDRMNDEYAAGDEPENIKKIFEK